MKRTTKRLTALLLTGTLLTGAGAALAFGGHHPMASCERDSAPGMKAVYQLDNLSAQQKEQLRTLRNEQRKSMRERMDTMRDNREQLREAMDSNDQAAIAQLAKQTGEQVTAMILARAEARQKMESILTEEQRQQFRQNRGDAFDFGPRRW